MKMIQNNITKAYSEVDAILEKMDNVNREKVPAKLREMFKKEKDTEYQKEINIYNKIIEKDLQPKTLSILAMLYLNYWCENDEEKKSLTKQYADNDKKREEEARKKYDPENLFKNEDKSKVIIKDNNSEKSLTITEKEKWYKKIFNFIRRIIIR